ncbi:guanine deaminase [Roseobacter denitrificans]|uniref:Guanine deaminase n=1 Tax=Roseobacter denitrificans (strain ATCC 33942 / OCh 114) TaxID=375451 RepID=Q168I1_ROSDO|nr:guanine deaminase [Roseobacter denitrificans]ABG31612.1 guanine deaminase [Roseobacter denitrificans OCh 114]AVL54598.1 guanine deaminase [Roseobacter denitrificans]SFF89282.1 guanine deaminase [Roseobacter denitrificans OCh 114]
MSEYDLILGQTFQVTANPMTTPWQQAVTVASDGAVLLRDGRIEQVGHASDLRQQHPQARITDYGDKLVCPGFVDAHVHYPQTAIIASWGKQLIDWLNTYTFPEETRLCDPAYARAIADRYLDLALAHGTTTVCSYATSHPASVDAFFDAAERRGLRVIAGKTCMDRNAPEALCDTVQHAHDESKSLLEKWHGRGRAHYAITPRFSPTSTPEQLEALGALWAQHPSCLMQTHLSEQVPEIKWVRELFPTARDYLDTYEMHGLIGERAVFGHAIHLEPREIDRIAETGAALVHCPTSNTFIGSGLMDVAGLAARSVPVGLATDTGGGSSFSMLRTMAAAYEVAQLRGTALHPAQLLYLATAGSARALHLHDTIGTLSPGYEADLTILDLASTPAISQRAAEAETIWEAIFPTIMMGDDRAIADVWIAGKRRITDQSV